MWLHMPNTTPFIKPSKPQESIVSQNKLETNYTLNLGQLLKMSYELKKSLW
jgi:hypothetical protein